MDVALLVHTKNEWSRKVLMGVAQFGDDQGNWNFLIPPANRNGELHLPKGWDGDGIICRLNSKQLKDEILKSKVPCVNVSWLSQHEPRIPRVASCEESCGQLAVDFLLEKQFENFAFVGFDPSLTYSSVIELTVAEQLKEFGRSLQVFPFPKKGIGSINLRQKSLSRWLENLPKPIAVIAWTSADGQLLTRACQGLQLRVPDDVAILCIEHDHLFSSLAPVPLTNIDQDPWRVGYSAAKLLKELTNGGAVPEQEIRIPPISVVPRLSTDATAVSDPELCVAVRFIYDNVKTGIVVKDVVNQVGISRRALETRFRNQLSCSPAAYIRKIQLQLVARLLRTTKLSVSQIAFRAGFEYPEVMMRSFKKEYSLTPMGFRYSGSADSDQ